MDNYRKHLLRNAAQTAISLQLASWVGTASFPAECFANRGAILRNAPQTQFKSLRETLTAIKNLNLKEEI